MAERTRAFAVLAAAVFLAASPTAPGSNGSPLDSAREHYRAFRYHECLQVLESAATSGAEELSEVEVFKGLCCYHLERSTDAVDHFQAALRLNPAARLPELTSPKVRQVFQAASESLRAKSAPAEAVQPATTAASQANPGPRSRPSLLLRSLPYALAGVAVAGAGGAVYFGVRTKSLEREANRAEYQVDAARTGERARSSAAWSNVGLGVATAAATGALVTWLVWGRTETVPVP